MMISLSKTQLQIVRAAASHVPPGVQFLERVSAMLQMRGRGHFSDDDVASVTALALTGLAHQPAA
jgi:hypothetical protein